MLIIDRISHRYERQLALSEVSFEAAPGTLTCLVGASGCGKTTLLRLAAGLMPLQAGRIVLDNVTLADGARSLPAEQRPVGLVFQEGALFPHMSVADNIGFGLAKAERRTRVQELLASVDLTDFSHRFPDSLSGGQRQRVALARALAPRPAALLFDEPYANLDAQLRTKLRDDAKRMVRETGTVGVVVTHDPDEVLAMADQVVVLEAGHVLQSGTPRTLYENPKSLAVALMFGRAQALSATLTRSHVETEFGNWPRDCLLNPELAAGPVKLAVRPHDLALSVGVSNLELQERRIADGADEFVLVNRQNGASLTITEPLGATRNNSLQPGDQVQVEARPNSIFAAPT